MLKECREKAEREAKKKQGKFMRYMQCEGMLKRGKGKGERGQKQ